MVGIEADPYRSGADTALSYFGLIKQASLASDAASIGKKFLIGDPAKYWKQLNSGKLFSRKGMIANTLNPVVPGSPVITALQAALMYGLPAYGLYQASKAPAQSRGSTMGAAIGGLIGGTVGAPLGLVGNIAGGSLGAAAGESLGRVFNTDQRAKEREVPQHHTTSKKPSPLSANMGAVTGRPS